MSPAARLLVVLLATVAGLLPAGPAVAHVGGGAAGSDFDARVLAVEPALQGVAVRVLSFGDELEVVNRTGADVEVPGYSDEPYLRIGPDGVWRNARSPATYINLDRFGRTELPPEADPDAGPEWVQVSTEPAYTWHDHRTHWMSEGVLPPAVAADPTRPHLVFEWTVPMVHGGDPVAVRGELTWRPPPSPWLIWPVYAALAAAGLGAGLVARGPRPLALLLAVGATGALWHALTTPEPPVTVSSHAGAVVSALLPALLTCAVAALGGWAALHGRGALTGLTSVVAGWLLLVQGLGDVDLLWTANVASSGPAPMARAAVAVLVALGLGLVVGGIAAVRRFREDGADRPGRTGRGPQPAG